MPQTVPAQRALAAAVGAAPPVRAELGRAQDALLAAEAVREARALEYQNAVSELAAFASEDISRGTGCCGDGVGRVDWRARGWCR